MAVVKASSFFAPGASFISIFSLISTSIRSILAAPFCMLYDALDKPFSGCINWVKMAMYAKKSPAFSEKDGSLLNTILPPYHKMHSTAVMPRASDTGEARSLLLLALFFRWYIASFSDSNLSSIFFSALKALMMRMPPRVSSMVENSLPNCCSTFVFSFFNERPILPKIKPAMGKNINRKMVSCGLKIIM